MSPLSRIAFRAATSDDVAALHPLIERAYRGETAKAALLSAELRVASVRKLIERRIAEAVRTQDRSDQKATDELASRAAWLRLAGTAPGAALGAV